MNRITIDNKTLTHLLGYLEKTAWVDALKHDDLDADLIKQLIKQQEETYDFTFEITEE